MTNTSGTRVVWFFLYCRGQCIYCANRERLLAAHLALFSLVLFLFFSNYF